MINRLSLLYQLSDSEKELPVSLSNDQQQQSYWQLTVMIAKYRDLRWSQSCPS